MRKHKRIYKIELETIICASCSMPFSVSSDFIAKRRSDHGSFMCPVGHSNVYKADPAGSLQEEIKTLKETVEKLKSENTQLKHKLEQVYSQIRERAT